MAKKKEQWAIDYEVRVAAIRRAINVDGHKFYLDTYLGRKLVLAIDADGSTAVSGLGTWSQHSWAICSTQVYPWAEEIGIPQDKHFKFEVFSTHRSEQAAEKRALMELDVKSFVDYRIVNQPNGLSVLWVAR